MAEKGSTATPTRRSATASETMKRLVTERSFELQKTAAMTRQLPTMTMTLMAARTESEASMEGSLQVTSSSRAAHAVAFSVSRIAALPSLLAASGVASSCWPPAGAHDSSTPSSEHQSTWNRIHNPLGYSLELYFTFHSITRTIVSCTVFNFGQKTNHRHSLSNLYFRHSSLQIILFSVPHFTQYSISVKSAINVREKFVQ